MPSEVQEEYSFRVGEGCLEGVKLPRHARVLPFYGPSVILILENTSLAVDPVMRVFGRRMHFENDKIPMELIPSWLRVGTLREGDLIYVPGAPDRDYKWQIVGGVLEKQDRKMVNIVLDLPSLRVNQVSLMGVQGPASFTACTLYEAHKC